MRLDLNSPSSGRTVQEARRDRKVDGLMLEQDELLIHPRDERGRRLIVAGSSGEVVGHATRMPAAGWWGELLYPVVMAVHESGDEPLLFTLRRAWLLSAWYEIREAEEQRVGRVLGPVIQNGSLIPCAYHHQEQEGTARIENVQGDVLARLERHKLGHYLVYEPTLRDDPFLKMLLLASALVHNA